MAGPEAMPRNQTSCPTCGYLADPGVGPLNFCPKCGQNLQPDADRTATTSLLGTVVADRYKLIAHLGEGGMGSVYKAEHIRMGKALAVKVLRGDFARDPAAVERFRSEARIVSRLSHPNTIAVFDFGEMDALGGFYLAMEYIPGRDLARILREEGALDQARAADIGQQILGSLAEAHDAGIIHRDMKPGNVMLMQTRPGEDFAKVLDFGIAKLRDDMAGGQTSAGSIVGTPNYLSPEQARGEPLDARADLYAVGCMLYELLSGQPPFAGRNPMAVVNAHLHESVPSLGQFAPGISRRLVDIVHRALAKRREERFASADEMREAILALGEPTSSRSLGPVPQVTGELKIARRSDFEEFERELRAFRRSRVAAPLWVLAVALCVGGLVWRWNDVYALLAARAPGLAARLPDALRPVERFDGGEHEPNDVPAHANVLPLPASPGGEPGGTVAVKGTIGARLGPQTGDADVFRLEVPPLHQPSRLVARWHADGSASGIAGLDVTLTLNRATRGEGEGERSSAPVVAFSNRGGEGQAEELSAPVDPGIYYLSVREHHQPGAAPVEKPAERYALEVQLAEVRAGEELEPNDSPEAAGLRSSERYADWLAMAEHNPLPEASAVKGELAAGDVDTFAARLEGRSGVLLALPEPGVALAASVWNPEAMDLDPVGPGRVHFEPAGQAVAGEPLLVPFRPAATGAPALIQLRAADGKGGYTALALGAGDASGAVALEQVKALAGAGRLPAALELAAAVARYLPRSSARSDVLTLAGRLASDAALAPADLPRFDRAARLLGGPVFEDQAGSVRYHAAFEQRIEGRGAAAEEAAILVIRRADPCTPAGVADRVEAFAVRFPASRRLPEVRLWRARALEAELFAAGWKDAALRKQALSAWDKLARGPAAAEARQALERLKARNAPREAPRPVCPDPGAG